MRLVGLALMTGSVGTGGDDGVLIIWLISGISARRCLSDREPDEEADPAPDPDAAAVTRGGLSEAVLEAVDDDRLLE